MLTRSAMLASDSGKWPRTYEYPFAADDFITTWSNLLSHFAIDSTNRRIRSTYNYNVDSRTALGYLQITTPSFPLKLTFRGYTSSESCCDKGYLYASSSANTTSGTLVYSGSAQSSIQTATTTLSANTTYYLNFRYKKDGSVHRNDDRFYIYSLTFERA